MTARITSVVLFFFLAASPCFAAIGNLDYTVHKLEGQAQGNTLLVVGGIQGDEPGGFNAAALLVSHYTITSGNVWIVPNLNFLSIIKSSRGVNGDLNRKFKSIQETDPDFNTIHEIKALMLDPQVDIILNLHDGSGFYREEHIDSMHSPRRWGQSVIIDQEVIEDSEYGSLGDIARSVVGEVNLYLCADKHKYHVKNTETRLGDKEMEKTLTYFAIQNGKAAFGVEASKTLANNVRAYYHLNILESYMRLLGIEFERSFPLTPEGVQAAMESNVALAFCDNKIYLDLGDVRQRLGYVPLEKNGELTFTASNPLITVVRNNKDFGVYYGNERITRISPQYFDYDTSVRSVDMIVDGARQTVEFGGLVAVENSFTVLPEDGVRVNVIGFTQKGVNNESGIEVNRKAILPKYSVDKAGRLFRVEMYKDDKFSGMVLVQFEGRADKPAMALLRTVDDPSAKKKNVSKQPMRRPRRAVKSSK